MMQNKKIKLAITGGYASGKSSVLKIFENNNFECYSADKIYADLLKNADFISDIYKHLNVEPIFKDNMPFFDREYVSDLCFNNSEKLQKLNEFTHKAVYLEIEKLFQKSNNKIVVFEIPLLFEDNKQQDFDLVLLVLRNRADRIKSGAMRDNISAEKAKKRIENQVDHHCFTDFAHIIIYNDKDMQNLVNQVNEVIKKLPQ